MRSKYSILNTTLTIISQVLLFIYSLVLKKVFLLYFPVELLGITEVFSNFFISLSLIDIGFSTIFVFNLYKAIAKDDQTGIIYQVSLFKTIYKYISLFILIVSLLISPFIIQIFNINYSNLLLIYVVFFIKMAEMYIRFRVLYKTNILKANQKMYLSVSFSVFLELFIFILQYLTIVYTKNYILYIVILSIKTISLYIYEFFIVTKEYSYLRKIKGLKFEQIRQSNIFDQCKSYLLRAAYDITYFSMDTIIISVMFSTDIVGYLSIYTMIFNTISEFLKNIFVSLRSSMADFMHTVDDNKSFFEIFESMNLINFFLASIIVVGCYTLINQFIVLWVGSTYLIDNDIVFALIIILSIDILFCTIDSIFMINGYMFKERLPIIFSALSNLFGSIILASMFGVVGVFIGTVISKIIWYYGKIYHVSKGIFKSYRMKLIFTQLSYIILLFLEVLFISNVASMIFPSVSSLLSLIFKAVFVVSFSFMLNLIIFARTKSFQLVITTIKNLVNKPK
ncbi:MAG: hypothetical protein RR734_02345 [Bacilli bacterium]|uniref:hypothetical protein n=1 Tax=Anaerorhabdus sp. TaxID=1872524 RepID=UPI002FC9A60C